MKIANFSILAILLFAGFFSNLPAQDLNRIQVFVTADESEFEIPNSLKREIRSSTRETRKTEILENWLQQTGYLEATVDSITADTDATQFWITPNCQYRLDVLDLILPPNISEEQILFSADRYSGRIFTGDLTSIIAGSLLSALEEEGFLMAEFSIVLVERDRSTCTIQLKAEIDAKEQFRAAGVRFEGVTRNNPDFLKQVTGIREGDRITTALLERGRRNLLNSELFIDVSEGELIFVNGEPFVLYEVDEQQLNFFDGLIGYVPTATGGGQLAGYGDILLRNALADGNRLELRYEQLEPLVSKLNVEAEQRYIAGLPFRAGGGFWFTQQDSSYLERNVRLTSGYELFTGFELLGSVRNTRVSASDTIERESAGLDTRATFFGLGFRVVKLDRIFIPRSGYDFTLMLESGRQYINDSRYPDNLDRSFRQTIFRGSAKGYYQLGNRQVLASGVHGYLIESPQFLITDLIRFGGTESIRGYREDQFRASAMVWGDVELRYLLDRNSYLFAFGAYGYYERPQLVLEETNRLRTQSDLKSLGFGVAFQSPIGVIKFSYAISPEDDLSNGKVHIGIRTGI